MDVGVSKIVRLPAIDDRSNGTGTTPLGRQLEILTFPFPHGLDGHRLVSVLLNEVDQRGLIFERLPGHGEQNVVDLEPCLGRRTIRNHFRGKKALIGWKPKVGPQRRLDRRDGNADPERRRLGLHWSERHLDLGLDLNGLLRALMKQDQAKRFVASRLETLLKVFGFAQWRIAQSQQNVVLADSRPCRHSLRCNRRRDQALPLGQFEMLANGVIDSRQAHSRAAVADFMICKQA